jgi:hypothetical protein
MKNYGIPIVLLSLVLFAFGLAWEGVLYILVSRLPGGYSMPWWVSYPGYVMFWSGVALFALGLALTLAYVFSEALVHVEKTRMELKRFRGK